MIIVEIDGVGEVEFDDTFETLSPVEQQKAVNEVKERYVSQDSTATQIANAAAKGFNVGVADVLGGPVDLVNAGLQQLNSEGLGRFGAFGLLDSLTGISIPTSDNPAFGSKAIREALTENPLGLEMGYLDEADLPEDQRAIAKGGRIVGQATGAAAPVFGASSKMSAAQALAPTVPSGKVGKDIVSGMIKATGRNPGQMARIEGMSALGAGTLGGAAEAIDPGNTYLSMPAEIAGGILGPAPLVKTTADAGRKLFGRFSKGGREQQAADELRKRLKEGGFLKGESDIDDPRVKELIDELNVVDRPGTTAQVTSNPKAQKVFIAVENTLVKNAGEELKTAIETQTKEAISSFNARVKKLQNSGNPEMVRKAAEMRLELFDKSLDKRLAAAQGRAGDEVARVLSKNSDDAVNASRAAGDILEGELKLARGTEKKLWGEVDKTVPAGTENTVRVFKNMQEELLDVENISNPVQAWIVGVMKRQSQNKIPSGKRGFLTVANKFGFQKPFTLQAKELFRARSRGLELARNARADNRFDEARRLEKISSAMLDDLMAVTDETAVVARDFSRTLNDKFNTDFMRKVLRADSGVALEVASSASDAQRALNFQAMKQATQREIDTMVSPVTTQTLAKMQKDFIGSAAAKVVNTDTLKVEPKKLRDFIRDNQQTLKEVNLVDDLTNVDQQVRLANMLEGTAKTGRAFAKKHSIAGQILDASGKKGGLQGVINSAFESNYQANALRDMVTTIKKANTPGALEGLRHSVYDKLIDDATIKDGKLGGLISGNKLDQLLDAKTGETTLRENLLKSNLLTADQSKNLNIISKESKILESSVNDASKLNSLMGSGSGMVNLLASLAGSKAGKFSMMGDNSLIVQGAFAKQARKLFGEVPSLKVQGILTRAIQDPKLMAMLLRKGTTGAKQIKSGINITSPTKIATAKDVSSGLAQTVGQTIKNPDFGAGKAAGEAILRGIDSQTGKRINAYLLQIGLLDSED